MKKKTNIKTVIRQIVREEVAMAIQEVISELKQPTQQVSQPKPKKKIVEKKKLSTNKILNDVLNETAEGEDWKTLSYDSSNVDSIGNRVAMAQSPLPTEDNPNPQIAASMGVDPDAPGMGFLKKDYRKTMKKVDKAISQKRGNGGNPL